jgi:CheY-like chemotaxis protein
MPARILLIEDDAVSIDLMTYLLKAYGHTVLCATDGREGLRLARAERPDLVLSDNQMPFLSGSEVALALKADPATRDIPMISVTASVLHADRARILSAGFEGCLTKPITPESFVAEVDAFLPADLRAVARAKARYPSAAL